MPRTDTKTLIRNLDHRVSQIEQILPTLATKEDVREIVHEVVHEVVQQATAPFATREEMHSATGRLATREEVKAEGEQTRRHFDVVAESIRADVRIIAEGHAYLAERLGTLESSVERDKTLVDQRLLRLEAQRSR